jgi:hypothetical protein
VSRRRVARAAVPALLLAALLGPAGVARAQQTISLTEYRARLDAARALAQPGVAAPSPARMDRVRDTLGFPVVVLLPLGTTAVDSDPLLAGLKGTTGGDFRRAVTRIDALRGAARDVATTGAVDPARLHAAVSSAYANLDVPGPGIRERLGAWVAGAVDWLLSHLFSFEGTATIVTWIVVLLLLAGLAFAAGRTGLARELRVGLVSERTARRDERTPGRDWLVEADRALAAGDLEQAVRALYRALLAALQARGVIEDAPSVTAGETRLAVAASRPALVPLVGRATTVFERVAYGGADASPEDVEAVRRAEREVRSA